MMRKVNVFINGTAAGDETVFLPVSDECRVIAARVVPSAAQAAGAVTVGKAGAGHTILDCVLDAAVPAGTEIALTETAGVTDAEKAQVFKPGVPIEIDLTLDADAIIGLELTLDPFLID